MKESANQYEKYTFRSKDCYFRTLLKKVEILLLCVALASAACSSADPLQTWLQLCLRSKQQSSHKCKKTQIARVKYCVRKYCSTFTQILLCTHRKRKAFIIQQRTAINIICLRFGEFSQYCMRWHWDLHCCLSVQRHCTRYRTVHCTCQLVQQASQR